MQQDRNSALQQGEQQSAKKVWVKPEVEVIDNDYIQSGSISNGPEGHKIVRNSTVYVYHS